MSSLDLKRPAATTQAAEIMRVEAVHKDFGGPKVLEDVTFSLTRGHVHSLIGPNGAGKTTLLNIVSCLYRPSAGTVRVEGHDLAGLAPHELAPLGVARTFQNLKICRNMTLLENVLLGAHVRLQGGLWAGIFRPASLVRRDRELSERARRLIEMVGLDATPDTMPDALSYGALKRLELARALMNEPTLLLLDEPAAGLDPREKIEMGRLIEQLASQRITVVLIEHDMKLVMGVSDHVVVLNYGRLIAEGTPHEVARDPDVIAAYLGTRH